MICCKRLFVVLALISVYDCFPTEAVAAPAAATAAPAIVAPSAWEVENPVLPLPEPPLGTNADYSVLAFKVTPEKVRLGRLLFYDKRISVDGTVSCATCHRPANAFSEPTAHSTGVHHQQGTRKSPTFLNEAWTIAPVFFWDGRAASLIDQAGGPMANAIEMGNTHDKVVTTFSGVAGYRELFKAVFGDDKVTLPRMSEAIAAYEATRMSGNSRYDKYEAGDHTALTAQEQLGRSVFLDKGRCAQCHITGANFTDADFHNLGIGWNSHAAKKVEGKLTMDGFYDLGRYKITKDQKDIGAFKTPTLREIDKHAPYMHDGSLTTLAAVVDHYDKGGIANPWIDKALPPLHLTKKEKLALISFLKALDGEGYQDIAPTVFPN